MHTKFYIQYKRIDDLNAELNRGELKPLQAKIAVESNKPIDGTDPVEVRVSADIETTRHRNFIQDTIAAYDGKEIYTSVIGDFSAPDRISEFFTKRWPPIVATYAGTLATVALEVGIQEPLDLLNVQWWLILLIAIPISLGVGLTASIKR